MLCVDYQLRKLSATNITRDLALVIEHLYARIEQITRDFGNWL